MAKLELSEETKTGMEAVGAADLLIAVAGQVDAEQLRTAATQSVLGMDVGDQTSGLRTVVAFPGVSNVEPVVKDEIERDQAAMGGSLRFLPYSLPAGASSIVPWIAPASTYQTLFAMARELGVSACAVVGFDLAALQTNFLGPMLAPVLDKRCELAMPLYALGKFDGLLNSSILAPLTRALYGKRVRFPLAPDFCLSAEMLPELEAALQRTTAQGQDLFWPAAEAAMRDRRICQVHVDTRHLPPAEGVDLSTILAQTVGPLFAEITTNASMWQRVRGSQPVETLGTPVAPPADGHPADTTPMLETFQLGFRNLQEVWSLVLPPVTLLELKRLSRVSGDRFHMPDELWVRIVCDFALAHRLRTLSRTHLLGALTPLYLGWVASYALEVGSASPAEAEQRLEKLARAYEEGKPYLLSRWRWPGPLQPIGQKEKIMWTQVSQSLHESMARVISRIATLLPGILALIVAVLFFAAIAWVLAWLVRRLLTAIRIDERLARGTNTIAEWSPTYTPTTLITRIVFWCVVLVGFLVGLEAFGASSDNVLTVRLLGYIPNVVGAVVLLILGNVIARFLSRSVLIGAVNMNLHYARLLSLGTKWLVLVLTAAMVLDHLSIGAAIVDLAFGILFGGIVLALALAVGLGSRDLVSRSLEREAARPAPEAMPEEQFRHF